jgi:hypothetical protein
MSGNKAEVDGKPFAISIRKTEFVLTGSIPTNDTLFYINRLTGEYAITPASLRGDLRKLEWSREGEGASPFHGTFDSLPAWSVPEISMSVLHLQLSGRCAGIEGLLGLVLLLVEAAARLLGARLAPFRLARMVRPRCSDSERRR